MVIVDEAFEAINKLVSDETYETVPTSTFVALKILSPGLNCLNEVPVPVTLVEPLETDIVPGPYILLDDKDFAAKTEYPVESLDVMVAPVDVADPKAPRINEGMKFEVAVPTTPVEVDEVKFCKSNAPGVVHLNAIYIITLVALLKNVLREVTVNPSLVKAVTSASANELLFAPVPYAK